MTSTKYVYSWSVGLLGRELTLGSLPYRDPSLDPLPVVDLDVPLPRFPPLPPSFHPTPTTYIYIINMNSIQFE